MEITMKCYVKYLKEKDLWCVVDRDEFTEETIYYGMWATELDAECHKHEVIKYLRRTNEAL